MPRSGAQVVLAEQGVGPFGIITFEGRVRLQAIVNGQVIAGTVVEFGVLPPDLARWIIESDEVLEANLPV